MSLWEWVLAAYERPGTPQACLRLQDEFGQNTSFLLWAAWTRSEDSALLARGAAAAKAWDEVALKPLRAVRRELKAPCPPVADAARERLREEVKAAELNAERLLVETLEVLGGPAGQASPAAAVTAAVRSWGLPASDAAVDEFVKALA